MHGSCLCGAVQFEAEPSERHSHACHCEMCRRWTGSALLAVTVRPDAIRFEGAEHIRSFQSSEWAERAWCGRCGSNLYYRITAEGRMSGTYAVSLGCFDEPGAFPIGDEIYIDRKPEAYAFVGEHPRRTKAEAEAKWYAGESA